MTIKLFRKMGPRSDWELNFVGNVWNLRIGSFQWALWRNYEPIFDWRGIE